MTTVDVEHQFVVYCEGKSCRQLYYNAAERLEMRPNRALLEELNPKRNLYSTKHLDFLGDQFLGAKGCLALLDVIRANSPSLVTLKLQNQGVDDNFVLELCLVLRDSHQRLETLDLSGNKFITNQVTDKLFELLKCNQMIHHLELEGTSIGKAVQRSLNQKCRANQMLEADFFKGDYVKLKKLFCELDSDGSGAITVGELLSQMDTPQVADALEKRFAAVTAQGGQLHMAQFLQYIHPMFNSLTRLRQHMADVGKTDPEATIVENWARLREILFKARINTSGFQHVRVTARLLNEEDWSKVLEFALEEEWKSGRASQMTADGKMTLHHSAFSTAVTRYMGPEEERAAKRRRDAWGTLRMSPALVSVIQEAFIRATRGDTAGNRPSHLETAYESIDLPFAAPAMNENLHSQTVTLRPRLLKKKLRSSQLGGSITANFVEWITFLNEQFDVVAHYTYRPAGLDRSVLDSRSVMDRSEAAWTMSTTSFGASTIPAGQSTMSPLVKLSAGEKVAGAAEVIPVADPPGPSRLHVLKNSPGEVAVQVPGEVEIQVV